MDEVAQRIHVQRKNFYKTKGFAPNIVILGQETFWQLKNEVYFAVNLPSALEEPQIFGMPIEIVTKDEYLAVGYVEKEEKLND